MAAPGTPSEQVPIRVFGGPTALIEYGGLRFLTDPTFDAPGSYASGLAKTAPASTTPAELGRIDVVLLSHDEHDDNLDVSGRTLLADVPLTLTTPSGAGRLGGTARPLKDWEAIELDRPGGGTITVTGVPALHGPGAREDLEPVVGEVVGFVLSGDGLPTVYVSGDNAQLSLVREIADRFGPVDTAVLFAGAVRTPSWTARCSPSTALRPPRPPASWAPAASCRSTSTAGPTSPRAASSSWTPSPRPA